MIQNVKRWRFLKLINSFSYLLLFSFSSMYALTLEQAVFQTLNTNPEIKEKRYNLKGVEKERDMVRSAYYPKLYLSTGTGKAKEEITPAYRESGSQVTRTDSSIVASLNIFSGFQTYHDSAAQRSRADAARSYLQESKATIVLRTIESFIMMMKHKAIVIISKENVTSHRKIYNQLKEKEKSGLSKASDLGFASGRLTLAQVNAVVHENNFLQSKVVFETILGGSVNILKLEEPQFDYTLPKSLEDAALIALDYNPSIQVSQHNIKSAHSNYKKSRSIFYPSLDIELKRSWFNETDGYEYGIDSSYAMIYLSYNIFNGFADKAQVEKDFSIYLQSNQYLDLAKRDVINKLGTSWIAAIKIEEQLDLLKKMRTYSKKTLEDYYAEFGIGKRTLLDIINVKNDHNNARQSYESAKYDLLLSKFRILNAMGGLVDYFLAKADKMELSVDPSLVDDKSVYDIIRQMNKKLQADESLIPYNGDKQTSLDALIKGKSAEDELDFAE